jgi:biotin operon repressor
MILTLTPRQMLSAEEFIKQHKANWSKTLGQNLKEAPKYDIKFYRSRNDIARDLDISRQTVAKRIGSLWFHEVEVHGVKYYLRDADIIKFAFYLLNK